MKKILLAIMLVFMAIASFGAEVGIASGQPTGTNYPMANDIARVCSTPSSPIKNYVSDGSLDNIAKVYGDKTTQYGFAQADAMVYQQGVDPKMMDRIMMVFPLFSSEFHIIVRADSKINSLADLQGKRVAEDVEGSGTWVSAQVIKSLTGIQWQPINASQQAGLNAVLNGSADAQFINAGRPIDMLSKIPSGIRLIPIQSPKLDQFGLYTKSIIPSGTYPFQKSSISTYKVDNVLITYAFKNQFQTEIGNLVSCMAKNIGNLQQTGHPKWRDVDPLDITRIKWQAHPAAVAAIKRSSK